MSATVAAGAGAGSSSARPASAGWTILRGVLRTQRRSLLQWSAALCGVAAMYTAFYPSIGGAKMEVMLEAMPPEMMTALGFDSIATAAGYVSATVYSLLGAILVLTFAIGLGARLVAGQEEDGVLELELTGPVSRRRVYSQRLLVLWIGVLVLAAALTVVLLGLDLVMGLELSTGNLLAASAGLLLFGGTLGSLSFAVGAATGRRAAGLAAGAGVAVVAYLLTYLGPLVGSGWMEAVSPYSWYIGAEPLRTGFDATGSGLLLALAVLTVAGGWLSFRRRDLMV